MVGGGVPRGGAREDSPAGDGAVWAPAQRRCARGVPGVPGAGLAVWGGWGVEDVWVSHLSRLPAPPPHLPLASRLPASHSFRLNVLICEMGVCFPFPLCDPLRVVRRLPSGDNTSGTRKRKSGLLSPVSGPSSVSHPGCLLWGLWAVCPVHTFSASR